MSKPTWSNTSKVFDHVGFFLWVVREDGNTNGNTDDER
jgi:hypothetical protein